VHVSAMIFSGTYFLSFNVSVQPVVDAFDPRLLIAQPIIHDIDFLTAQVPTCSFFSAL